MGVFDLARDQARGYTDEQLISRLTAEIDSLRATLATEREEGERLREAAKRLLDSISGTVIWDGGHPSQAWRLDERAAQHLLAALSARPSPTEEA